MVSVVLLICTLLLVPNVRAIPSCVIPNTTVCNIDYRVPASIALIAAVFESEIQSSFNSDINQGNSLACSQSLKDVRCARSFPRCSDNFTTVTVTSLDCEQRLGCATTDSRQRLNAEGFCSLKEKTVPLQGCKPATQYGYAFNKCDIGSDVRVTEWMIELLRYEDTYLSSTNVLGAGGFLSTNYPSCSSSYAQYHCSKAGQCDPKGALGVNYTRSQCQQALNCYPAMFSLNVCDAWPNTAIFDVISENSDNGTGNATTTASPSPSSSLATASPSPSSSLAMHSDSMIISGEKSNTHSIGLIVLLLICALQ
ncbi:hypothetical protein EMCRGX_G034819 [Ephydatia muelleri]